MTHEFDDDEEVASGMTFAEYLEAIRAGEVDTEDVLEFADGELLQGRVQSARRALAALSES